jgi:release factor glutamine methyltransferase
VTPAGPGSPAEAVARGTWLVHTTAAGVTGPTTFRLHGREWDLLPGVFAPTYCLSTRFFTDSLPLPVGGAFLEVGCGTGVTAVLAAVRGCARVTATDISPVAVENTRLNVARHGVGDRVTVIRGDVFDGLGPAERFDLIFWNSPFVEPSADLGEAPHGGLNRAVFDPGYRAHERFLSGAAGRLAPAGRLLLGFANLGNHAALGRLAAAAGYRVHSLRVSGGLVPGVEYQLLELVPVDR